MGFWCNLSWLYTCRFVVSSVAKLMSGIKTSVKSRQIISTENMLLRHFLEVIVKSFDSIVLFISCNSVFGGTIYHLCVFTPARVEITS